MNKKLSEKINEALTSVVPITAIVFALAMYAVPIPLGTVVMFLAGAVLLIVGMGFFSLGADIAMMPLGDGVGAKLGRTNIALAAALAFFMGTIITMAEPDLAVLATQVPSIPNIVLTATVAVGVGIFLAIALVRTFFGLSLSILLFVFYGLLFAVAAFAPGDFIAVAFDSGGVTTGPMTVPFIMALGVGLASSRGSHSSQGSSFGIVALCSIGPVIAVLLLGILYEPQEATVAAFDAIDVETTRDVTERFIVMAPEYLVDVLKSVLPIAGFFAVFQAITRRYTFRSLQTIAIGFLYTLFGLVLFLTGVNVGFIPVGHLLGAEIASSSFRWMLLPIGAIIGYYTVAAEPAVHVLTKQVEDVSNGAISRSAMRLSLSLGVGVSLLLSMLRILTGLPLFVLLIPGYLIAIAMTFKVPKIFTGIAFDSGGVASGPMTSTFILPFAMGACGSVGGNLMTDAFGVIAMVAMTPLITIQALGLVYARQMRAAPVSVAAAETDDIVEFDQEV